MSVPFLYTLPFWALVASLVGLLILATELGYRLGAWRVRRHPSEDLGVGDVVLGSMLALVGLVLAFTYGYTVSHYEVRKQTVVDEANAIGSAFQRADLASEPGRTELRVALRDYAATRVVNDQTAGSVELVDAFLARTAAARDRLWPATRRVVEAEGATALTGGLVTAITQVLDLDTSRVARSFDKLPLVVLLLLLFLVGTSLALAGYDTATAGKRNRVRLIALTLVLAAVIAVVTDFDRTVAGFIRVDQTSLEVLIEGMDVQLGS